MFFPRVKVMRTIFPYEDGWGVVIKQFGKADTVLETGISKEEAEQIAITERLRIKNR